jgi:pyrroloquinoline quinone biosynthesis protein E
MSTISCAPPASAAGSAEETAMNAPAPLPLRSSVAAPLWLLAELTYRCPLHCPFCYNPVDYAGQGEELSTAQWIEVMRQARALGSAQLGFSGGEPLLRDDLEELVGEGRRLGFYTNLITSGIGLSEARIARLKEAGLDHIQLSFQDSTREMNDFLSSSKTFDLKARVARLIKQYDYPMVLNVVLHRFNLDHVGRIIEMALDMGVDYLELANTQYYGWGLVNRAQLMPTREQLLRAEAVVNDYRARIGNKVRILFVVPDYFEERPKACMNGWGSVFMGIAPDGTALPYRGDAWMTSPCSGCPDRHKDFGGCRCQAYALTGDAANADPVCAKSPQHADVHAIVMAAQRTQAAAEGPQVRPLVFRSDANSRRAMSTQLPGQSTGNTPPRQDDVQ